MKQSDLLRKQADMIDMAEKYGIDDWRNLVIVSQNNMHFAILAQHVFDAGYWKYHKFALDVIEGKPLFESDMLYTSFGIPYVFKGNETDFKGFSWNLPKPKTVTVELLREDAERYAQCADMPIKEMRRVAEACRKALEEQK